MIDTVTSTLPDPPVRDDGRCAHCGKTRKITAEGRRYAGEQLDHDPFCSTDCCRDYHGCPRTAVSKGGGARGIEDDGVEL